MPLLDPKIRITFTRIRPKVVAWELNIDGHRAAGGMAKDIPDAYNDAALLAAGKILEMRNPELRFQRLDPTPYAGDIGGWKALCLTPGMRHLEAVLAKTAFPYPWTLYVLDTRDGSTLYYISLPCVF